VDLHRSVKQFHAANYCLQIDRIKQEKDIRIHLHCPCLKEFAAPHLITGTKYKLKL